MTSFAPPSDSPLPFKLGDVLAGKYRVDSILGEGGMGVVVRATHLELERLVAVKVIRREMANYEQSASRLVLEARAAAKIRSEHAGKVLDVGRLASGEPYIVMEYLEGYDLAAYLKRRGRLQVSEAVDLLLQACDALAQAHDAQIVHRDLKPENLFLSPLPDGTHFVKVLDFGISKDLAAPKERALTAPQAAIGSPQYMAPEQMEGQTVDPRADVWALGIILYEMLSGAPPFDGETLAAICVRVLAGEPKALTECAPGINPEVARVVHACLQKRREQRPNDIRAVVSALAPYGGPHSTVLERRIVGHSHAKTQQASLNEPVLAARGVSPTLNDAPASRTVTVNRSLNRTPIFIAMGSVCVLGAGAFWLARGTSMHTRGPADPRPEFSADLTAQRYDVVAQINSKPLSNPAATVAAISSGAIASATSISSAIASVTLAVETAEAETLPAPTASNTASRVTAAPRSGPKAARKDAPRAATQAVPPSKPKADKAWDPDSFGGRQ